MSQSDDPLAEITRGLSAAPGSVPAAGPIRSSLAGILKVIAYIIWAVTGLVAFVMSLAIVNHVAGFWGVVIGFSIAPVTFVAAPWYAVVAWGNWLPLIAGYGGTLVAGVLLLAASLVGGE